ncbi:hypothetical protein V6259_18095 [Marinomonas sp. TI.3.20]|uniref:hypothetical protein n=1 Tax=Marinomonas sp. TI.3.20 TaxID=3121296 RepID=UPI00311E7ED9
MKSNRIQEILDGGHLVASNVDEKLLKSVRDLAVARILSYRHELQSVQDFESTSIQYLIPMLADSDLIRVIKKIENETESAEHESVETLIVLVENERRGVREDDALSVEEAETLDKILCFSIFRLTAYAQKQEMTNLAQTMHKREDVVKKFTELLKNCEVNASLKKARS